MARRWGTVTAKNAAQKTISSIVIFPRIFDIKFELEFVAPVSVKFNTGMFCQVKL